MIEVWKDIPNYEGMYQVSNLGNVKSLSRTILKNGKYPSITKEILLKPSKDGKGYYFVYLSISSIKKAYRVHQLVLMAFNSYIPNRNSNIVIDHINNIRIDNRLENLQVITQRQNLSKDKKGTSKFTGVHWNINENKWMSGIKINGKRKHLGYFKCELKAHYVYQKALKSL